MLDAKRCCLTLVDVQEKLLAVMAQADKVVKNCQILLQIARRLQIPILWCQQYPQGLGETAGALKPYLEGLAPIDKVSFSCCGQPEYMRQLEALAVDTVILCGIESHVCVFQTAMDLIQHGFYVHLVADAVSSRTLENKQIGIQRMAACGVVISSVEMMLFELLKSASHPAFKELSKLIR